MRLRWRAQPSSASFDGGERTGLLVVLENQARISTILAGRPPRRSLSMRCCRVSEGAGGEFRRTARPLRSAPGFCVE